MQRASKKITLLKSGTSQEHSMYMMPEGCPLVTSTGESVIRDGKCFVWHPHMHIKNGIPHPFVADAEAVKVLVNGDFQVASRVTHNVPYFGHVIQLKPGLPAGDDEETEWAAEDPSPEAAEEIPENDTIYSPSEGGNEIDAAELPKESAVEVADGEIGDGEEEQKILESDEVRAEHCLHHLPKAKNCPICTNAKMLYVPARKFANQSELRMTA